MCCMSAMKRINARRIDLNLLIAFEAIYEEGSVTAASQRLSLTQSALSHALARLRELCGDPLFERHGKATVPTAKARSLIGPVQAALGQLERSLNQPVASSGRRTPRRLSIGLISLYEAAFVPQLVTRMGDDPAYEIEVAHYEPGKLEVHLESGRFDVAIQMQVPHSNQICSEVLINERLAILARADHPAAGDGFDLHTYLEQDHVLVIPNERWPDFISMEFERLRLARRIVLRCQDYWTACKAVAGSHLLLTAQRAALQEVMPAFPETGIWPMPRDMATVETSEVCLYWHVTRESNPDLRWLRGNLRAIFAALRHNHP
ncbi:MAG: HTH-type transcriptional regulator LeuO [Steroidobacteraceae bacterium]|nr:HTH-type transcriptional regulator LeuO [Steroidobacteraceae bacterium]